MEILAPDMYCGYWRVLYCGDEIYAANETEAKEIAESLK